VKKFLFVAAAALIISGTVYGQSGYTQVEDLFDRGNAVEASSTAYRYGAGQFTTDVDDFIDVNSYDPKIGTFLFGGGWVDNRERISVGIGKTLKSGYLGLYYGGNFIRASGEHDEGKNQDDDVVITNTSTGTWFNRLAVLFGTSSIGAFRFDLAEDTSRHNRNAVDTNVAGEASSGDGETIDGPIVALTWGINLGGGGGGEGEEGEKASSGGLSLYATLGVDFPNQTTDGYANDKGEYTYKVVSNNGGSFFIQAGAEHGSGIWGDIGVDFGFPTTSAGSRSKEINVDTNDAGYFALGMRGGYSMGVDVGKISIGLGPSIALGVLADDNTSSAGGTTTTTLNDSYFQLFTGFDLGLKYAATPKFELYTGASLQLFRWTVISHYGGDADQKAALDDKDSNWMFDGIAWTGDNYTGNNNLNFGLIIKPVENLSIGFGLNIILDALFTLDLSTMQFTPGTIGTFFTDNYDQTPVSFDLVVSLKF